MSRPVAASAAKVKRRASVPKLGMPSGKSLRVCFADLLGQVRLHHAAGALVHQGLEVDAVDEVDGVEHVALGLGHLVAVGVAHQAVDVDLAEGHVVHELQAHHDHAGHPEEDDVEAGDQHAGGVEGLRAGRCPRASRGWRRATAPS